MLQPSESIKCGSCFKSCFLTGIFHDLCAFLHFWYTKWWCWWWCSRKRCILRFLRWAFFWSNKTNLARCHSWHYYIGITCSHTCINGLPGYHLLHHSAISRPLLSKLQNWSRTKRRQESKRLPGRKSSWWVCATSCTSSAVAESSRTSDTTVVLQSSSLYTGCRQSVICHFRHDCRVTKLFTVHRL